MWLEAEKARNFNAVVWVLGEVNGYHYVDLFFNLLSDKSTDRRADITHSVMAVLRKDFIGFTRLPWEDIQEARIGNRPIIIEVTAANAVIDLKCATELGLIINELVTNCLKHAFPANQEGRIDVSFCREYEEYVLIFQDNGIGIPAAEQSAGT